MKTNTQSMRKGKLGLFGNLERTANIRNSKIYLGLSIALTLLSLIIFLAVKEISSGFLFFIFSAFTLVISLIEFFVIKHKDGRGKWSKYCIIISFILSAIFSTSTLGTTATILFAFPILCSIPYCSFIFTVSMSALNLFGLFTPILLSSFLNYFDLNVIVLYPNTTTDVISTLELSISESSINVAATKINEIISIYLPVVVIVVFLSICAALITKAMRNHLLKQYDLYRDTRE